MSSFGIDPSASPSGHHIFKKKGSDQSQLDEIFRLPERSPEIEPVQQSTKTSNFKTQPPPIDLKEVPTVSHSDLESMTPQPKDSKTVWGEPLTGKYIGDSGTKKIANEFNQGLRRDTALFLSKNGIGDQGAIKLFDSLQKNQSLKHLILSRNQITSFAAAALADMLKVNHHIGWLVLSKNKLADAGISTIGQGLKYNKGVKHVVLDDNYITDSGVNAFLDEIASNITIESLFLQDNLIQSTATKQRLNQLKETHNLKIRV